jgi:hypothetical protein
MGLSDALINSDQNNHSTYPETYPLFWRKMLHNLNVWNCLMILLIQEHGPILRVQLEKRKLYSFNQYC